MSAIWPKLSGIQGWHWARTVALSLTLFIFDMAQSTAQGTQSHLFRADAPIDAAAEKWAINAVKGLDARGQISYEGVFLKVRADSGVRESEILDALNTGERHFIAVVAGTHRASGPAQGFPVRIDTGDSAADDRRYEEAKRAWVAANPDLYNKMQELGNGQATPAISR